MYTMKQISEAIKVLHYEYDEIEDEILVLEQRQGSLQDMIDYFEEKQRKEKKKNSIKTFTG